MHIDLRSIPPETRAVLLRVLGEFNDAVRGLLTGARESADVPLEKLGVVAALIAIVRSVAEEADEAGRAALRDFLAELAGVRDDLRAAQRQAPPVDDVDDLDQHDAGEWTP